MANTTKKRSAPQSKTPQKRWKPTPRSTNKEKTKQKVADRDIIPIPSQDVSDFEQDIINSEQDLEVLEGFGQFLSKLDEKGIARSKKETERLHQLNKPQRKARKDDGLPSIDSHSDDDEPWQSDIDDTSGISEDDNCSTIDKLSDSDAEMSYEKANRKITHISSVKAGIKRLPIKLANGHVQATGENVASAEDTEEEGEEDFTIPVIERPRDDVATGARFGRAAVVDVISTQSRHARIAAAKEQIGSICQEIVSDPENSRQLGLLRRLNTFSLATISTPTHPDPVVNDPIIRKLTILSQLAVYKDIIPGYSIRPLTDQEKSEKVSQMVSRSREWEQGLLVVYQTYLRGLETEIRNRTDLSADALRCMCTLLKEATHFNFRVNIMSTIVAYLSKKSWTSLSELCLNSLISVFREDLSGESSLEVVRLLNRMVKEKHFNIRPEVLGCLLHLRLKSELDTHASDSRADSKTRHKFSSRTKDAAKRSKGKSTEQPHLSKKARQVFKENLAIQKEFREAEVEIDKEERAKTHTETLKLVFVLYFKILKHPKPTPLLPAALEGVSKYSHLVNIDFFRDLMQVLKNLIVLETPEEDISPNTDNIEHRLRCIVTAYELLSGQGEALNIDLADFTSHLYAIIPALSLFPAINDFPSKTSPASKHQSLVDMLFRALNIIFSPRSLGTTAPSWSSAAFAKRLLTASMHWPAEAVMKVLNFVGGLIAKDPKLQGMLSSEDRTFDGIYRSDIDDPQLCNPFGTFFWELYTLQGNHWDAGVREEAQKILSPSRL